MLVMLYIAEVEHILQIHTAIASIQSVESHTQFMTRNGNVLQLLANGARL